MIFGDFNEITRLEEKVGREDRNANQMAAFREALLDCSLQDMGFNGTEFTWSNNRESGDLVPARLDRGVADAAWVQLFPHASISHLIVASSNHVGLLLDSRIDQPRNHVPQRKRRLFRFKKTWLRESGYEEVIQSAWEVQPIGTAMYRGTQKIKQCQINLLQWSQSHVRVTPKLIDSKMKKLQELELQSKEDYDNRQINLIRRELNGLYEKVEVVWRQHSRIAWLTEGVRNTKFFRECALQRKKINTIMGLTDQQGNWRTEPLEVEQIAVDYFSSLFASSNPRAIDEVLHEVDGVVTPGMNNDLMHPFTHEEIKRALFQMHPSKAPGPDGMSALFFQKYWHIVGSDVSNVVLDFLNNGRMLGSINFTHLVLIPKVVAPEKISQFRPISLCNVIYKIVSKVLVNKMKTILPQVISYSQSAFVPSRMITDNVIIAFETIHYLKNLRNGNNAQMAVKLDMSKAYDRVEWAYLQAIMIKLGFHV
jgi:hypothetical protein